MGGESDERPLSRSPATITIPQNNEKIKAPALQSSELSCF
jgi:hypothetical protein